jgi:23S rRNA (pseudouridine1915-N3)-methyltransferase
MALRIAVIAVGRVRDGPEQALCQRYTRQIVWPLAIHEVEARQRGGGPAPEGDLLLQRIPDGATVVALDGRGQALGSEALASRIANWRDGGVRDLAFLIGGADGLSDAVRRRADLLLSLGPMTWPHLLARAMLLEQLYRAQQILAGHPYHRA